MPELLILEFSGIGEAEYEAVNKQLGIDMTTGQGDWPPGLLMHCGGTADSGELVVTEVWSSRQDQQAFLDSRLGAALAAGGVTSAPHVRWLPLLAYHALGT